MSNLEYPSDLQYTSEHEWVKDLGNGSVRIGITAYAQDQLGDVVYVSLPEIGESVESGEGCGEVESTKSVSDVYPPFAGEVTAVNESLDATPELLNTDPYGEGWIFEMKVADPSDMDDLLDAEAYTAELD